MSKKNNPLVTIVFVAEGDGDQGAEMSARVFKTLEEQVYKNTEILVTYINGFHVEVFRDFISKNANFPLHIGIDYFEVDSPEKFIDSIRGQVDEDSEYVFLKTSQPNIWSPFHVASHIEDWDTKMGKRKAFQLSNLAVRDIQFDPKSPVGALGYRLKDPNAPEIILDEISIRKANFDGIPWGELIMRSPEKRGFDMDRLFSIMRKDGVFRNKEITVSQLIPVQQPIDKDKVKLLNINTQYSDSSIVFVDENQNIVDEDAEGAEIMVLQKFPTIAGNKQWDEEHNQKVIKSLQEYEEQYGTKFIKKIGIKRTMGMGDVILTQPFVKFITQRYPEADIIFYTAQNASNILAIQMFKDCKISDIKHYDIGMMMQDVLSQQEDLDLRFDLDTAYESRGELSYAEAYFKSMGYEVPDGFSLAPEFSIDMNEEQYNEYLKNRLFGLDDNVIAFCPEGSGWDSKEMSAERWIPILKRIKDAGFKIALTNPVQSPMWQNKYRSLEEYVDYFNKNGDNAERSFNTMRDFLVESVAYIGSDNGVMHLATGFNKPMFIVNGAATIDHTNKHDKVVSLVRDDLECIGCKHRFFFDLIPQQNGHATTFVPPCTNDKKNECMNFTTEQVLETFIRFEEKYLVPIMSETIIAE